MLLDPTKGSFEPGARGYIVRVDSMKVSERLQSDMAPLRKLISSSALFSDNDAIPGIHCPLDDKEYDRAKKSYLALALRNRDTFKVFLKEQRDVFLIRMRIHYLNYQEKTLMSTLLQSYQQLLNHEDLDISIS